MRPFLVRLGVLAGATLIVFSCSKNSEAPPVVAGSGQPYGLEVVGGDSQYGTVHAPLSLPVRVRLLSPAGNPAPGMILRFSVANGGSTSAPAAETDSAGEASVAWTLGTVAGPQSLTVQTDSSVPTTPVAVRVTAVGLPGPAVITLFKNRYGHTTGDSVWTTRLISEDQFQNPTAAMPVRDADGMGGVTQTDTSVSISVHVPGVFRYIVGNDTLLLAVLVPIRTLRLVQFLGDTVETLEGQLALQEWVVPAYEPAADSSCFVLHLSNAVATHAVGGAPPDSVRFTDLGTMLSECSGVNSGWEPWVNLHKVAWPSGTYDLSTWLPVWFNSTGPGPWLATGETVLNSSGILFTPQDTLVIK